MKQFFEGLGLGASLAQAHLPRSKTLTMAIVFCLTTPLGVACGIAASSEFAGDSPTSLCVKGAVNALSAGVLIYLALVDLIGAFTSWFCFDLFYNLRLLTMVGLMRACQAAAGDGPFVPLSPLCPPFSLPPPPPSAAEEFSRADLQLPGKRTLRWQMMGAIALGGSFMTLLAVWS